MNQKSFMTDELVTNALAGTWKMPWLSALNFSQGKIPRCAHICTQSGYWATKVLDLIMSIILLQTKDGVFTLCAMTYGIRRNWIQAVMKNIQTSVAPDVTWYIVIKVFHFGLLKAYKKMFWFYDF